MSRQVEKLKPETLEFLGYLRTHPEVRARIHAPRNCTLLYAGQLIRKAFEELGQVRHSRPEFAHLRTLEDVLKGVQAPGSGHGDLYSYATSVCNKVPKEDDQLTIWRALSGIFASQAEGVVSFHIGSDISGDKDDVDKRRIFALTELPVLERNGNIDPVSRDALAYYRRCLVNRNEAMNFSFIGGAGRV